MDCFIILAQAAETASTQAEKSIVSVYLELMWEHITTLGLLEALTFISFGTVCLFYGWRVFKVLVTISFALLGLLLGVWINRLLVEGNVIWLAVITTGLFAFLSISLMRWGVSVLGAAAGGIITGGVWLASGLPEQYIWAGGAVGFIGGFLISFIIFKAAVMLFTSMGGSALVVVGILAVLYQYMGAGNKLEDLVFHQSWFLPAALLVPMAVGIVLQNKFIKGSQNWDI